MLGAEKFQNVLDLGCGEGTFTVGIKERLGLVKVVGVDNNRENMKKADAAGVETVFSDLNQPLPFPDASFDLIFSNFAIEHLFNVDNFIKEIKRILKVGGCAIVGTENLASTHNLLALVLGMQPFPMSIALSSHFRVGNSLQDNNLKPLTSQENPHIRVFAYQGLKDIFRVYAFKVERVAGSGYPPFWGWLGTFLAKVDPRHAAFNLIKVRK